ncbi:hypothetical protein R1sor_027001 [Riccia sorocarpa]|uniref:Protein kinase domain-containing protein n=1 Tax=Riccia sorocarpa TaxID=122646 RepID=A0ABD3GCY6_9MARC
MKGDEGTKATRFGGTIGYLSPEYSAEGLITEKLDVYSYGILLLEIVSGRECIDHTALEDQVYLRNWAFHLYRKGCLSEMAEKRLLEVVSGEDTEIVLKIALSCLQENYKNRPSMNDVVLMLTGNASGVALDIVDELHLQQQTWYSTLSLYETPTMSKVSGTEERDDQVLLESTTRSHSNGASIELTESSHGNRGKQRRV